MFDWDTPKKELNDQDVVTLLTSKFSMRLNMERKRIEHVTLVSGTKEIEEPQRKKPKHLPLSPNSSLAPTTSLSPNTSLPPNMSLPLNVPHLQIPATNTSLQTAYPQHTANMNSIPGLPPTDTSLQTVSTQDTINIHSLQDPPPTDSSLQTAYSLILSTSIACKITHQQIPACKVPTPKIVLTSKACKILHLEMLACKLLTCHAPKILATSEIMKMSKMTKR